MPVIESIGHSMPATRQGIYRVDGTHMLDNKTMTSQPRRHTCTRTGGTRTACIKACCTSTSQSWVGDSGFIQLQHDAFIERHIKFVIFQPLHGLAWQILRLLNPWALVLAADLEAVFA